MNNRVVKILLVFILSQLISSCATVSYTPIMSAENKPKPGVGYIYGRYTLSYNDQDVPVGIGVILENTQKTNNHTIQFLHYDEVSVIAVKPGTYSLTKVVYSNSRNVIHSKKSFNEGKLTKPFSVEAGKLYYLADFFGQTSVSDRGILWEITSIRDNYNKTTEDFRKALPNFKNLQTKRALE